LEWFAAARVMLKPKELARDSTTQLVMSQEAFAQPRFEWRQCGCQVRLCKVRRGSISADPIADLDGRKQSFESEHRRSRPS
jgi:hypothetical protein